MGSFVVWRLVIARSRRVERVPIFGRNFGQFCCYSKFVDLMRFGGSKLDYLNRSKTEKVVGFANYLAPHPETAVQLATSLPKMPACMRLITVDKSTFVNPYMLRTTARTETENSKTTLMRSCCDPFSLSTPIGALCRGRLLSKEGRAEKSRSYSRNTEPRGKEK
jgi:hypothetical protein